MFISDGYGVWLGDKKILYNPSGTENFTNKVGYMMVYPSNLGTNSCLTEPGTGTSNTYTLTLESNSWGYPTEWWAGN